MANLKKLLRLITLVIIILLPSYSYSQTNRNIDDEKYMKGQKLKHYRPSREERSVMKIEKAQEKKKNKQERTDRILHKRAVKKHNKLINGGGKDLIGGKKTYKRMKKSKRESKQNNTR